MYCVNCGERTIVSDSRPQKNHVLRKRKCNFCNHEFNTHEILYCPVSDVKYLPRSLNEALSQVYYYTGKPCKHGHYAIRNRQQVCTECSKSKKAK